MNNLLAGSVPANDTDISNPLIEGTLDNIFDAPNASQFLSELLPNFIGLLMVTGTVFFMFMILIGAVQWIISGGDKAAIEGARGRITSALVGVVILFSTFALIKIVETFFGIDILTIDIGPLVIQ